MIKLSGTCLFWIFLCKSVITADVGDLCNLQNGQFGTCTEIRKCKAALEDIKSNKQPVRCGFVGVEPIVCCVTEEAPKPIGKKSADFCDEYFYAFVLKPPSVFNGEDAKAGEFPHMAVLGFGTEESKNWLCGGTLISSKFIVTAGHCLYAQDFGDVKFARLGELELNTNTDKTLTQDFNIIRRFKHPEYRSGTKYNDIALVELDKPAQFTDFVGIACLHTKKEIGVVMTATGWGRLGFSDDQANHLQVLKNLEEYKYENCSYYYKTERTLPKGIVDDLQICAGKYDGDTCQGDSGGPLVSQHKSYQQIYELIGVTSFGKACGISKSPGVYTRVSNYIEWIESIVWPN